MEPKNNMANLPESVAKQPIVDSNPEFWAEKALPLIRKVFQEMKPNGVIFKRDDGQLIICPINDGKFDWDHVMVLNMEQMTDKYDDISAVNPFEFVFCKLEEDKFTTFNQKTTIPNTSFSKLYDSGLLEKVFQKDYENQFGTSSV